MKIPDWTIRKYQRTILANLKSEWDEYLLCADDLKNFSFQFGSWVSAWLEQAAFIRILPRQIGKTHFLMNEAIRLGGIVLVHNTHTVDRLQKIWNYGDIFSDYIRGTDYSRYLFIDEYDFVSRDVLNKALCLPWKGVMMLSSSSKSV